MNGIHTVLVQEKLQGDRTMSQQQFEQLRQQINLLTPQQLKALQGEISDKLVPAQQTMLTDEELSVISKLFS
ncbi:hypothetical protein LNL84_09405 [Vibrio sp. ZSDZ34]|jgi:hypothetical protein|uniref:Uncharacterized protein n=1 Tax=Vibrio gelatinilyticus TaxID=2893468 RepID=A0A9X2AW59_9VIBR|nr:hypothetical protein [Vibrio gelatinilyticus]MCJ2377050.1 hypothetical protein [Vibrio gelatinilyticus]